MRIAFVPCLILVLLTHETVCAQTSSLQDLAKGFAPADDQVTIYVAREFLTMDANRPKAEAAAVKNGKFLAVGAFDEVKAAVGEGAKVDRSLADKVVTAGFVEQHVHPVLAALTMTTKVISIEDWDAIDGFSPAVRDPESYHKRLFEALKEHRDGPTKDQPFVTWGYHHYMHGTLSRGLLNKLAPDFPVIVWHRSCHEFYFNNSALRLAGIDKAFIDNLPQSAKDQASWENGHFFEQGALAILGKITPLMASREQFVKGLEFTERYYHRNGITVCCEPGGFPSKAIQELINSVYSDEATPFNHYFMADGKSLAAANPANPSAMLNETTKVLEWGKGRTRYLPKQVKLLTDGAIFSQLMMMRDGYTDGHKGAWIMDPPLFGFAFQSYWDAGYQIHIHNNGDAGLDVLLGELEKAMARSPRQDHRTVLVHFGFARPEQVEKWIKLGGIVSSNPYYVTALAGPYASLGLTPRWAENMVPHGEVLKHGGSLSFHSDMPMAPAKPLQLIWAAVNRFTYEGNVAGPKHKVPLEIALKAMTIDAAYSIQLESKVGSIEVGKDANLTILNEDPYGVPPEKLKEITVWGTMLEGRLQPVLKSSQEKLGGLQSHLNTSVAQTPERKNQTEVSSHDDLELMAVRRLNAEYFQQLRRREISNKPFWSSASADPQDGVCGAGCSCSLNRVFGDLIATQLVAEPDHR
jgi:predicted amidohydrolase YtcJ